MESVVLRKLMVKDIPFMLEWMHDSSINTFFRFNAKDMNEETCKAFISDSHSHSTSRHYAIADENDEYLGTISLKNIDIKKQEAEYAISTRKKVHGTGVALFATKLLMRIAKEELGLKRLYLNVLAENVRANAFYKKIGFYPMKKEKDSVMINGLDHELLWYQYVL